MQLVFAEFCLWQDVNPGRKIIEKLGSPKNDVQDGGNTQETVHTPLKTNIFPENWWLEDDMSFLNRPFQGAC